MSKILIDISEDHHVAHSLDQLEEVEMKSIAGITKLWFGVKLRLIGYQVIHFQFLQENISNNNWYDPILRIFFLFNIVIFKISGGNIVWTGHHATSHEVDSERWEHIIRRTILRLSSQVIVLAPEVETKLQSVYNIQFDCTILPLGDYSEYHRTHADQHPRAHVDITQSESTIGIIGHLREYKRVPLGILSYEYVSRDVDFLVAGSVRSSSIEKEIRTTADRVSKQPALDFRFLSHADIYYYYEQMDVALILNDQDTVPASLHTAVNFNVPVVTTRGGVKEELVKEYEIGTTTGSTPKEIASAIDKLLEHPNKCEFERFNQDHTWEKYREGHKRIYNSILEATHS